MRQINFLIIFAVCLALVLFSLENTEPVPIQIVQGIQVQAPLCIELILSLGIGAVLAWFFSIWLRLQRMISSVGESRQKRDKNQRIEELEQDLERYKAQLEQYQLPPASDNLNQETEIAEIIAQ